MPPEMTRIEAIRAIAERLAEVYADGRGVLGEPIPPNSMIVFMEDAARLYDKITKSR